MPAIWPRAIDDADAAKALRRHFDQRVGHLGAERLQRHRFAGVHEVAGVFQERAELAAGMQHAEIHRRKAAAFQQRNRQRVAERQHHQRGGGGREVMRAGLARLRQRQRDVGGLRQRGFPLCRHRDHRNAETLGIGDEVLHLRLLAGPGQRQDDVLGGDHAEIAVARLRGVNEKGGRAGRGKGRRDLAADMA